MLGNIAVQLENGEIMTAPIAAWILAFIEPMSSDERNKLYKRVQTIVDRKIVSPAADLAAKKLNAGAVTEIDPKTGQVNHRIECDGGSYVQKGSSLG